MILFLLFFFFDADDLDDVVGTGCDHEDSVDTSSDVEIAADAVAGGRGRRGGGARDDVGNRCLFSFSSFRSEGLGCRAHLNSADCARNAKR